MSKVIKSKVYSCTFTTDELKEKVDIGQNVALTGSAMAAAASAYVKSYVIRKKLGTASLVSILTNAVVEYIEDYFTQKMLNDAVDGHGYEITIGIKFDFVEEEVYDDFAELVTVRQWHYKGHIFEKERY